MNLQKHPNMSKLSPLELSCSLVMPIDFLYRLFRTTTKKCSRFDPFLKVDNHCSWRIQKDIDNFIKIESKSILCFKSLLQTIATTIDCLFVYLSQHAPN